MFSTQNAFTNTFCTAKRAVINQFWVCVNRMLLITPCCAGVINTYHVSLDLSAPDFSTSSLWEDMAISPFTNRIQPTSMVFLTANKKNEAMLTGFSHGKPCFKRFVQGNEQQVLITAKFNC
ncbi:hypothetical protein DMA11_06675 [Marinilabiliaceae bacterium JC017]|nr:hypothetical protein DMA11_06675 [Marinilabiliaceae bacterium JC017]